MMSTEQVETLQFSNLNRKGLFSRAKNEVFDLIVIGGGVTGCGIALDAASRGMKVLLLEKEDFAAGTSSKSTKLIHGGLRYLAQLDIALVQETGTERAIVHRLAPHLVVPEKMLMPIVEGGTYGKWAASFGVMVYDLLAGVEKEDKRKMLDQAATSRMEPLLDTGKLKGSCYYAEYRTDDARLTIELAKRAVGFGAIALNSCKVASFLEDQNGKVVGVNCIDMDTGDTHEFKARKVVSATGPWVDGLRKIDGSLSGKRLHLTKGVHLVFDHAKLPINNSIYFDVPGGRMVFAIPRGKITYVGTTDTNYKESLDSIRITKQDVDYVLTAIRHAFPSSNIEAGDIQSSWAGLRPLIHEDGKSPSELSRKDEIFESSTGLISIAGGKLTGYRKMSMRIVDLVNKQLGGTFKKCYTKKISLPKESLGGAQQVIDFQQKIAKKLETKGLSAKHAEYLVHNYGLQTNQILADLNSSELPVEASLLMAELRYCLKNEMINSSSDFLVRRTGRLYFDVASVRTYQNQVHEHLASQLQWGEDLKAVDLKELHMNIECATVFPNEEVQSS